MSSNKEEILVDAVDRATQQFSEKRPRTKFGALGTGNKIGFIQVKCTETFVSHGCFHPLSRHHGTAYFITAVFFVVANDMKTLCSFVSATGHYIPGFLRNRY